MEEPATPAVGLTEQDLFGLGITKRQPIFKRLLGKEPTDGSVLDDIEDYLNKGHGSEESRTKLAEFKNRFAPKPPEVAAPAEPPPSERLRLPLQTSYRRVVLRILETFQLTSRSCQLGRLMGTML